MRTGVHAITLIEAIKSGRPWRRKCRAGIDYRWTLGDDVNCAQVKSDQCIFTIDDVLADDWEILEAKVEITRAQFWGAAPWIVATSPDPDEAVRVERWNQCLKDFARRLGLDKEGR